MPLNRFSTLAATVSLLILAGCSGSATDDIELQSLDPSSPAYAGLPQPVVQERLSDPVFIETLESSFASDEWEAVVQVNVAYTVYCREMYSEYKEWTTSGVRPDLPRHPVPDSPAASFTDRFGSLSEEFESAADSGDPSIFRDVLLLAGGCPDYPLAPGSKETIADALSGP